MRRNHVIVLDTNLPIGTAEALDKLTKDCPHGNFRICHVKQFGLEAVADIEMIDELSKMNDRVILITVDRIHRVKEQIEALRKSKVALVILKDKNLTLYQRNTSLMKHWDKILKVLANGNKVKVGGKYLLNQNGNISF